MMMKKKQKQIEKTNCCAGCLLLFQLLSKLYWQMGGRTVVDIRFTHIGLVLLGPERLGDRQLPPERVWRFCGQRRHFSRIRGN